MANAKEKIESLIESVKSDIESSKALSQLLKDQAKYLRLVDSEGLELVNPDIERLTFKIKENGQKRVAILNSFGLDANDSGISKVLEKLPKSMSLEIEGLWEELKENIETCKSLNEESASQLIKSREKLQSIIGGQDQGYPDQTV